jgi:hypothetical protein
LIVASVESEGRGGDDLNVELCEVEVVEVADTFESAPDHLKRVLGCVEKDASGMWNGKVSKARRA